MPAPESTKFQVNYSLPNGTLVNIYATTVSELEAGLADLAMNALNIRATGAELSGGAVAPAPAAAQRQQLQQLLHHLMQHQLLPLHLQVEIRFAVTE
jgi:hypothetical protein